MADFTKLVECMKKAALGAVDASDPVMVRFGNVVSASPLKINVEQKMTLEAPQLILARNVTTHTIQMTVDHFTEDEKDHTHTPYRTLTRVVVHLTPRNTNTPTRGEKRSLCITG